MSGSTHQVSALSWGAQHDLERPLAMYLNHGGTLRGTATKVGMTWRDVDVIIARIVSQCVPVRGVAYAELECSRNYGQILSAGMPVNGESVAGGELEPYRILTGVARIAVENGDLHS